MRAHSRWYALALVFSAAFHATLFAGGWVLFTRHVDLQAAAGGMSSRQIPVSLSAFEQAPEPVEWAEPPAPIAAIDT
ncbi:MAG: hypothetical protein ACLFSG_09290, partial [Halothiobacillaceae bacterium]